jgi:tRNA-specific 2-thiouridylase
VKKQADKGKTAFAKRYGESRKVFVGMSGGVDSSVSAALLQKAGYDITGVFLKVWHPDWMPCEWKEERRDAMRVAAHLNIPFITIDLEKEYKKSVVDYMIAEYKAGRTPNPDVMCNKEIKFGSFLKKAKEMGADFIATGHYAQIESRILKVESGRVDSPPTTLHLLTEGADKNKDQSYFLWTLTQRELKRILFPVGHLQKSEVRALARKFKLPTAEKKDSQGICFIGKVDMKEFLEHYITAKPGNLLNEKGEIIGTHSGALFYTIGQRHGFTVAKKTPDDHALYVIAKDIQKNTITVSKKMGEHNLHITKKVNLEALNWVSGQNNSKKLTARIRYRQEHQPCKLLTKELGQNAAVEFTVPQQGVSPGQSVVIYDGEVCLGGGIIKTAS